MSAEVFERRAAALRRHACFERAVAIHTNGVLAHRESLRDINKILAKEERYRAFTIFVMLAAEAHLERVEAVGYREYYEILTQRAAVSDRTARTVADLLVHFRFAAGASDPADRRRRLLVPSERTFDYAHRWSQPVHEALAVLGRPQGLGDRKAVELTTFSAARDAYCASSLSFFDMDADFSRIFAFLEGGSLVSMAAVDAALACTPPLSRSDIADRFGISRAQVSRVVAEGRDVGLFTQDPAATASPRLLSLYLDCEARVFAFVDIFREQAVQRLRESAPMGQTAFADV